MKFLSDNIIGVIMNQDQLKELKMHSDEAIRAATKIAYEYFCECDIGPEREYASDVYDNVRCATRRGHDI